MWKEYNETFDGVHASQRLKTEVLNMKREENAPKKRRIPAVALVAAILAVALAGTAVAAERLASAGVINIHFFTSDIPAESLPDTILERAARAGVGEEILPFDSWSEAEESLGMEIADNARLDQMEPRTLTDGDPEVSGNCLMELTYGDNGLSSVFLVAGYQENELMVNVLASLHIAAYPEDDRGRASSLSGDNWQDAESYVTPSGLETAIVTVVDPSGEGGEYFMGSFVKDNVQFIVYARSYAADSLSSAAALESLKEILDAYE